MGNLEQVFRREATQADRLAAVATVRAARQPFFGELVPGSPMLWYLAQTYAGLEVRATAHLAARRIGAYLPMILVRHEGRMIQRPMFPEYVFLLVSDIAMHRRRLRDTPGIMRLVLDGDREAVLPDTWVGDVQRAELRCMFENGEIECWRKSKRKRRGRRSRPDDVAAMGHVHLSMACRSYTPGMGELDDIAALDDARRVGVLHKALGLITATSQDAVPGVSAGT